MVCVLVIEDEATLRKNIERSLGGKGFEVVTAPDVAGARQALKAFKFDIACLNINLPDGNGLDFLEEARAAHPGLLAIIISGTATPEDRLHAKRLGVHGFLNKPFRLAGLVELISEAGR
jgi:DNA-binding response OmpR family regulator